MSIEETAKISEVSTEYITALEAATVKFPAPHVLFALGSAYCYPYLKLMELAGHLRPKTASDECTLHGLTSSQPAAEAAANEILGQYRVAVEQGANPDPIAAIILRHMGQLAPEQGGGTKNNLGSNQESAAAETPMSEGKTQPSRPCGSCAPEFGCWDGTVSCRKAPPPQNEGGPADKALAESLVKAVYDADGVCIMGDGCRSESRDKDILRSIIWPVVVGRKASYILDFAPSPTLRETIERAKRELAQARQKYQEGFECVPFCELAGAMDRLCTALAPFIK